MSAIAKFKLVTANSAAELSAMVQALIDPTFSSGLIGITGPPAVNDSLRIGVDTYTFVAHQSAPFQVAIGASPADTAANLASKINANSRSVSARNVLSEVQLTSKVADELPVLTESAGNVAVSPGGTLVMDATKWQPLGDVGIQTCWNASNLPQHQVFSQTMVEYA